MADLVIRGAQIALPGGELLAGDVAVEKGRITAIGASIAARGNTEIDADGRLLMPGVIDPQVHFREPGAPQKEDLGSGSWAAVSGGVTSFLEMPNTDPATINQAAIDDKLRRAAEKSVANYGFFIGATPDNLDALNSVNPVCGIKIFMGSSTGSLLVNRREDLERIFANGYRQISVHAEDEQRIRQRMESAREKYGDRIPVSAHSEIRDDRCALAATELAVELSEKYGRRLHILHMSTALEADFLRNRKPEQVTAEVIPNHLFLNVDDYEQLGALVQMNPPIRTARDNEVLWQALKDGVVDFIATDHAPHTLGEKQQPYPQSPSGMPGVELSLPLILDQLNRNRCSVAEVLKWMCEGPAQTYRIRNKGRIDEGADADLTLVDLALTRTVDNEQTFTRPKWTPYHGRTLTGWPVMTIVGGQLAFSDGEVNPRCRGRALEFGD